MSCSSTRPNCRRSPKARHSCRKHFRIAHPAIGSALLGLPLVLYTGAPIYVGAAPQAERYGRVLGADPVRRHDSHATATDGSITMNPMVGIACSRERRPHPGITDPDLTPVFGNHGLIAIISLR
jgi:hypothetical protein